MATTAKFLTKSCKCAVCGGKMAAGSAFVWNRSTRSEVGGKVGGSYSLKQVESFKPRHVHDCLANAVRAQRMQEAEAVVAYAMQRGATAEEVAAIRANAAR